VMGVLKGDRHGLGRLGFKCCQPGDGFTGLDGHDGPVQFVIVRGLAGGEGEVSGPQLLPVLGGTYGALPDVSGDDLLGLMVGHSIIENKQVPIGRGTGGDLFPGQLEGHVVNGKLLMTKGCSLSLRRTTSANLLR